MMETVETFDIGLRGYVPTERISSKSKKVQRRPNTALIIDCETVTPETISMSGFDSEQWGWDTQRLLFGRAIRAEYNGKGYIPTIEYLFYPDDLPSSAVKRLKAGIRAKPMGDGFEHDNFPHTRLYVMPLSEFLKKFYYIAIQDKALIIGFNLSYDLTRITRHFGFIEQNAFKGGFSLAFWTYRDKSGEIKPNKFKPRLQIKHIDSKRTLYQWTGTMGSDGKTVRRPASNFLDVKTFIFALTSDVHSLASASKKYLGKELNKDVEHGLISESYIQYNRDDVLTTLELTNHFLADYDQHPISSDNGGDTRETALFSTASVGKAYLKAMGIKPRLHTQDFPYDIMGYCMASYYGGRTEVRIRKTPVPVVYVDFLSLYPTVNSLMNLWQMVTAREVKAVEDTKGIQRFLETVTLDKLFEKDTWKELTGIVEIEPDGDILPVRAKYGETWNIGLNYYYAPQQWYALPDVVASVLLTGKVPKINHAYRFVSRGKMKGLKVVDLMGKVTINPKSQDFFRFAIEERFKVKEGQGEYHNLTDTERDTLQLFLKILANSCSYGIYAEVQEETTTRKSYHVYSNSDFETEPMTSYERAGRYFFAPMATLITSASRLMLALLEYCVTEKGGIYAAGDTDSMMVVADRERREITIKETGENGKKYQQHITALAWSEVDEIVKRFEKLNPYSFDKSILKIEDENRDESGNQRRLWCYAISSKRYCLYTDDKKLVKWTYSGFGFLLSPLDLSDENRSLAKAFWNAVIHDIPFDIIQWAELPRVYQLTLTTTNVMRPLFNGRNTTYDQGLKPNSFFMTVSIEDKFSPIKLPEKIRLVSPLHRNPDTWMELDWTNFYNPRETWKIVDELILDRYNGNGNFQNKVEAKTIASFLHSYLHHPEYPFIGCDGKPCGYQTMGLLERRHVQRGGIIVHGKEGNDIDEAETYVKADDDKLVIRYEKNRAGEVNLILSALADVPKSEIASKVGVSRRTVERWFVERYIPRACHSAKLMEIVKKLN